MTYDFQTIEPKWQKIWEEQNLYATVNGSEKVVDIALSKKADIAGDTLADGITAAKPAGYTKDWDINGEKVTIGVEKV